MLKLVSPEPELVTCSSSLVFRRSILWPPVCPLPSADEVPPVVAGDAPVDSVVKRFDRYDKPVKNTGSLYLQA